jgi:hypothetical protein
MVRKESNCEISLGPFPSFSTHVLNAVYLVCSSE